MVFDRKTQYILPATMAEQIFYFFSSKRILYNILLSIFTHMRNIYFLKKDIAWYKHLGCMTHQYMSE